jgi:hypothetical protein
MAQTKITGAVRVEAMRMVMEAGYTPTQAAMKMRLKPKDVAQWVDDLTKFMTSPEPYSEYLQREIEVLQKKLRAKRQECIDLRATLPPHLAELFPDRRLEQD